MAARLQVPVFYAQGIRNLDKLLRQLSADARVTDADKQKAREAASVLMTICAQAQIKTPRAGTGNA